MAMGAPNGKIFCSLFHDLGASTHSIIDLNPRDKAAMLDGNTIHFLFSEFG